MMLNKNQRQPSAPMVVAKDNLKMTETKSHSFQNKENKIMNNNLKQKMENKLLYCVVIKINE